MKSGFVELVIKKVMGNKSTSSAGTIPQRYRPIDSFKKYLHEVLPTMEEAIEIEILKKNLSKIKSRSIRTQLINAYLRRLYRLRTYEKDEIGSYKRQTTSSVIFTKGNIYDPTILKSSSELNVYDLGSYVLFKDKQMEKVFKHGCFGRYHINQFASTRKFGIQVRQEALALIKLMKMVMENKNKEVDWEAIRNMSSQAKMDYVNDEKNYPILFMALNKVLHQKISKYRWDKEYLRVWGSSVISDTIINSILQSQEGLNDPFNILDQVIENTMKPNPTIPSAIDFSKRFKTLPGYESISIKKSVPEQASYYVQSPSFKSFFLGGKNGAGRSMILTHLSMFAYMSDWIVVNVPDSHYWTQNPKAELTRYYNGLYLMNADAIKWVDQFLTANEQILKKTPVNMQLYDKHDITGVHDDEPEPVPNVYYEDRKTHFDQISKKFKKRLLVQEQRRQIGLRISKILSEPKNLYEVGKLVFENPEYATMVMAQLLYQVYALETPILECVDGFNWLYRPTSYSSFRYFNDRGLFGKIPPYHIGHARLFLNLDGHKIKNGMKVVAPSTYPMHKHKFDIKQLFLPENYEHKVRNLTLEQFKKAGSYSILADWWFADDVQRANIQYSYTLSQGNWVQFQEIMNLGHYY